MESRVGDLRCLLANVSSETLTGARLNRIQKQIGELDPAVDRAVAANSPEAEELGSELGPKATRLKEAASAAAIRAQRTAEQLDQLDKRLDNAYGDLGQIRANANELLEMTRLTVDRIGLLRHRFETQGPLERSREELAAEADQKLALIRELDKGQREALDTARERLAKVAETLEQIGAVKEQTEELGQLIREQRSRLSDINGMKGAFEEELLTVRAVVDGVKKKLDHHTLFSLKALISGIEKDAGTLERSIADQRDQLAEVSQLLEQMSGHRDELNGKVAELEALRSQLPASVEEEAGSRVRREVQRGPLNEKVAQLETEAHKLTGIFDAARLEAQRAVEAANVYKEVAEALAEARTKGREAAKAAKEANEAMKGHREPAKMARARSKELSEKAKALDASQVQEAKARATSLKQKTSQMEPRLAQLKADLAAIRPGKGEEPANLELDTIRDRADQAHEKLAPLNDSFLQMGQQVASVDSRVRQLMDSSGAMAAEAGTARDQIQQVDKAIPDLQSEWEEARQRLDQTVANVKQSRSQLAQLKERVALARDKANRVKLGAHFERGSFLELPMPQQPDDLASMTDIRFFVRTREPNGLLFYLGSDNAQMGGEFVAIELESGRPKLTLNLGGRTTDSVLLDAPVNDAQWRELAVQRLGKRATLRAGKPGTDEKAEEKSLELGGPKSVLNLFDDSRRLFVGGLPSDFQMPSGLQQRQLAGGDMDKLRVNGELVGFWNSQKAHGVSGAEMRQLPDSERNAEAGVTFNNGNWPAATWTSCG